MKGKAIFGGAMAAAAVSIAVIFTIQSEAKPISDAELQKKTESLPEVKAFLSKYSEVDVQFNDDGERRTIDYFVILDGTDRYRYLLSLDLLVDEYTGEVTEMTLWCTKFDGISESIRQRISENIEEAIRNDTCLKIK